jgi:hypothetical protein
MTSDDRETIVGTELLLLDPLARSLVNIMILLYTQFICSYFCFSSCSAPSSHFYFWSFTSLPFRVLFHFFSSVPFFLSPQ